MRKPRFFKKLKPQICIYLIKFYSRFKEDHSRCMYDKKKRTKYKRTTIFQFQYNTKRRLCTHNACITDYAKKNKCLGFLPLL